jgi:adenine-specific DNA-methyltransferase
VNEEFFETPSSSPNFQTELAAQLAEIVPETISDGKIDVLKLQELLAQDAAETSERFGLFWPGKQRSMRMAQMPTSATLRPEREKSKDWRDTKNVFIEGDNLEVLKILQKHYHGKVKMIYIDPPYNTGKDFVYPDNYKEGLESYLEWTKQVNEEGRKLATNSETEGRYHSNWLTMMYPRLKLSRNLLSAEGVVFISIDDNEQDNLKKICNEIFGEANFVAQLPTIMNLKGNNDQFGFAGTHEYTFVYAKNINTVKLNQFMVEDDALDAWEEDPIGLFKRGANLKATGADAPRAKRPNMYFPIYVSENLEISLEPRPGWAEVNPITDGQDVRWRWSKEKFKSDMEDVIVVPSGNSFTFYKKQRPALGEVPSSKPKSTFYKPEYSSGNGTAVVKRLFDGKKVFDNPKPLSLIEDFIQIGLGNSGIVLDLFAGSATVAHAVMAMNSVDGGTRSYIAVQLPEPTKEDSEAKQLGFLNIADVSRERIRRAGQGLTSNEGLLADIAKLDTGFRSYRLSETAFTKWQSISDGDRTTLEQHLFDVRDSASDESNAEQLLVEILLKQGYSLSEEVENISIAGLDLYSVGGGLVIAHMNEHIKPSLDALREVVDASPQRIVFLEDAFQGDDELKINLVQLCKAKNIDLWTA